MFSLAFIVRFLIRFDFSECPFDALEGGFTALLGHFNEISRFRVPEILRVFRNSGAEKLSVALYLADGLRLQGGRKEREKEDGASDIKNRYNKRFAGKLPPCIRLTMPTRVMVLECLRRFGKQSVDMVFEQVEAEPFSMGGGKTGFIARFQFIFDPKNFQGYLERAKLRIQKKQQPQQKAIEQPIQQASKGSWLDAYAENSNWKPNIKK